MGPLSDRKKQESSGFGPLSPRWRLLRLEIFCSTVFPSSANIKYISFCASTSSSYSEIETNATRSLVGISGMGGAR